MMKDKLKAKQEEVLKNREKWMEETYANATKNPNNMSFWLPKIQNKGFHIPETVIIPIPKERFFWLMSDNYTPEATQEFSDWLAAGVHAAGFDTNRELFIKTGNFSNKFCFNFPYVKTMENIGEQFLNVFYGSLCVGCAPSPEAVVREFIHTSYERKSIYYGMKLNTEFRVFYDFSQKRLLKTFDYWDRDTMQTGLHDRMDRINFEMECEAIEKDFIRLSPVLEEMAADKLKTVELSGIWSVDFLWDGNKFWLIDMAVGEQSAFYSKLEL